jgi:cytochrome c-type biogenesis protein CcmH/NrfF
MGYLVMGDRARRFSSPRTARMNTRHSRSLNPARLGGVFVVALLAVIVLGVGSAAAKSWSYDLAGELMSPYCPGRTLSSCPSPQAAELVQWMVVQEAGGATQEQVVEMLIERFGEEILGAPPAKGITLWAYVLPVLGFVVGGGLVVVALRRIVAKGVVRDLAPEHDVTPSSPGAIDDDLAKRVDADLASRG